MNPHPYRPLIALSFLATFCLAAPCALAADLAQNVQVCTSSTATPEQRITSCHAVIQTKPNNAAAYNNLGTAYNDKGQHDLAIQAYQKAIALYPKFAETYFNLGCAYDANGQRDLAIQAFQKALEINPNDKEAKANLAQLQPAPAK